MLDEHSIAELLATGQVGWAGALRGNALLLTLDGPLATFTESTLVDPMDSRSVQAGYGPILSSWQTFDLQPRALVLVSSARVTLPPTVAGMISTLSHAARLGLTAHLASAFVQAGFDGHLTLEILNASPSTIRLHRRMPIARLLLFGFTRASRVRPTFYGPPDVLHSRYADEFSNTQGEAT